MASPSGCICKRTAFHFPPLIVTVLVCVAGVDAAAADAPWAIQFRLVLGAHREERGGKKKAAVELGSFSGKLLTVATFKIKSLRQEPNSKLQCGAR